MSTRRNKQPVSLPAQPKLTPEQQAAQQLVCVSDQIKITEHVLTELKQRRAELLKSANLPKEPEKLWPCPHCPAQLRAGEVFMHVQGHYEPKNTCMWCDKPVAPEDQSGAIQGEYMHKWCLEPWEAWDATDEVPRG